MNLLIIGSTGGTGRQLVKQALELGHTVTAFARTPSKLDITHENLRVVQGNVLDDSSIQSAMQGQDAVLCALGLPASNRANIRANGTRNVVRVMEEAGIKRLVCQTTLGIGDSQEILPWYFKYLVVPLILRHVFADHEAQEECIRQSNLDWVLVRPANLTDGEPTEKYQQGFDTTAKIQLKISRADVANFMLKQLTANTYLYQAPGISY